MRKFGEFRSLGDDIFNATMCVTSYILISDYANILYLFYISKNKSYFIYLILIFTGKTFMRKL